MLARTSCITCRMLCCHHSLSCQSHHVPESLLLRCLLVMLYHSFFIPSSILNSYTSCSACIAINSLSHLLTSRREACTCSGGKNKPFKTARAAQWSQHLLLFLDKWGFFSFFPPLVFLCSPLFAMKMEGFLSSQLIPVIRRLSMAWNLYPSLNLHLLSALDATGN